MVNNEIRQFDSGATRDTDQGKLDPEGFLNPLVIKRYCEFMNKHRVQSNGELRPSDNWQLGIDKSAYAKSLWRHFLDFWLHHRGYSEYTVEDLENSLCAIIFNACGYLHEILKIKDNNK